MPALFFSLSLLAAESMGYGLDRRGILGHIKFITLICRAYKGEESTMHELFYDATDPALIRRRLVCKDLCAQYNRLLPSDLEGKEALLRRLLGSVGQRVWIEPTFWCDYGDQIHLGEDFYANHNLVILDAAPVTFGDHCFIAPNCGFYTAGHPLDFPQRDQGLESAQPITVGNHVWIGGNVSVLPGVTIGDGAVIGAGSVVTRDIPPNMLAVGNPCRPVRPIEQKAGLER